ncbi:MAG: alpha/beta hydrolase, partial [Acidimicrobiia bacterium]|nr:alpha/beta hydrolase [Acidimicrobiia bacterium]
LVHVLAGVTNPDDGAFLLAYSYGALISLNALATTDLPIRAAVLYEPPLGEEMVPRADDVARLVADAQYDTAMALFVESTFYLPRSVIDAMRRRPTWQVALDHAATLPPELEAVAAADVPTPRRPTPPVRVLVAKEGGNPTFGRIAERIQARFDPCDVVGIPGLPHFAMPTEPVAFAAAALSHFAAASPDGEL